MVSVYPGRHVDVLMNPIARDSKNKCDWNKKLAAATRQGSTRDDVSVDRSSNHNDDDSMHDSLHTTKISGDNDLKSI